MLSRGGGNVGGVPQTPWAYTRPPIVARDTKRYEIKMRERERERPGGWEEMKRAQSSSSLYSLPPTGNE